MSRAAPAGALVGFLVASAALGCGGGPRVTKVAPTPERPPPVTAAPESPLPDEAPEPLAPATGGEQVKIKLLADGARQAHVFWGRKDLGAAPLEVQRPRNSGPLDLLVTAPGFLPLHTRAFTDHDDTVSLRLYDEASATALLGYPVGRR